MTIGIGLQCPEGIVMLTDSMTSEVDQHGFFTPHPGVRRPLRIPSANAVCIISGNVGGQTAAICAGITEPTFEGAFHALGSQLAAAEEQLRLEVGDVRYREWSGPHGSPTFLMAGGPGPRPRLGQRLGKLSTWAQDDGAPTVFAIGVWLHCFLEPMRLLSDGVPPRTLAACITRATSWAAAYIEGIHGGRTLDEMLDDGRSPTVGYPLNLVTINATGEITEQRIFNKGTAEKVFKEVMA